MFVHILLSKELSANLWVILNEIDNVHIGAIALFEVVLHFGVVLFFFFC